MKDSTSAYREYDVSVPRLVACLLLIACTSLSLWSCSADETRTANELTVAGTAGPGTYGERHWQSFRDRVQDGSNRLNVRLLVFGELGSEEQQLSALRRGRVQIANISAVGASTSVPELSVLYAPFLFDSEAEADFVYDRYLTEFFRGLFADHGLVFITWYETGFHHLYSTRPLRAPGDVKGLRLRVSASPAIRGFATALGADVIPLGFGDIVPSLQTGLIDAGEAAISVYARTGLSSQAPHLTLTAHAYGVSVVVANLNWWRSLHEDEQSLLMNAYPSIEQTRRTIRQETRDTLTGAVHTGIQLHALDAAERVVWREATRISHERLLADIGGRASEVYVLIEEAKGEFKRLGRPGESESGPPI